MQNLWTACSLILLSYGYAETPESIIYNDINKYTLQFTQMNRDLTGLKGVIDYEENHKTNTEIYLHVKDKLIVGVTIFYHNQKDKYDILKENIDNNYVKMTEGAYITKIKTISTMILFKGERDSFATVYLCQPLIPTK